MTRHPAVAVIGAGFAGLSAAAELQRRGCRVLLLDRAPDVASSWRARYDGLRLNTVRWLSGAPGSRIPRRCGRWVARDEFVRYLETFTARRRIELRGGVEVSRIDRGEHGWLVHTATGEAVPAVAVVVATGHDRVPHVPDWPGADDYRGRLVHTSAYTGPASFADCDVLVVGCGNSGGDVATQLAANGAARVQMAVRTPPNVLPRELLGVPLQPAALVNHVAPDALVDLIARGSQRLAFGDLGHYGLATPPGLQSHWHRTGRTPIIDDGFVEQLRRGRIEIVPTIERLSHREVVLMDGQRLQPDVVIAATGFRPGLEPLVGHLGALDAQGLPREPRGREIAALPGLRFLGFTTPLSGALMLMRWDARRIARELATGMS